MAWQYRQPMIDVYFKQKQRAQLEMLCLENLEDNNSKHNIPKLP